MADFAPYQDIPPERNRALSPPPASSTRSPPPPGRPSSKSPPQGYQQQHLRNASRNIGTAAVHTPTSPNFAFGQPNRSGTGNSDYFNPGQGWSAAAHQGHEEEEEGNLEAGRGGERPERRGFLGGLGRNREDVGLFETRLGIRMDFEACLAYLVLPPVGGVLLLILEQTSDYVRFHAWQSSLLFTFLFIVHVIFSWSSILSWLIFAGDMALIAFLTFHAYKDATTLDRYEVPFFGPLASSILDDE